MNGPVALVAHDAGGAEVASSLVRAKGWPCVLVAEGPARRILEKKFGGQPFATLDEAVAKAEWVLCGTSWESGLERQAIGAARAAGKKVVAILDHWTNYAERFTRAGELLLPDEIWVGDRHALHLAQSTFPGATVVDVGNPYLVEAVASIGARTPPRGAGAQRVLYVCQPIGDHAALRHGDRHYWGYAEEDALRFFLTSLDALGVPLARIVVRPHPSEGADKYAWARAESPIPLDVDGSRSLEEEIAESDIVAGCNSMAMVVAVLAGRRVIECVPPGGRGFLLPHPEIESLQALRAHGGVRQRPL